MGPPPYHPSWYQAQLPRQILSLSKCQLRKHCKPKNSDYQRPCKVKRSHGKPLPGVGDQVKAATRTSQVSQVTSRAPALRLCSHQSSLLSPYNVPCVACVHGYVLLFIGLFQHFVNFVSTLSLLSVLFAVPQVASRRLTKRAQPFAASSNQLGRPPALQASALPQPTKYRCASAAHQV